MYPTLAHVQAWNNYVSIYSSYELSAFNNVTKNNGACISSYYWHMPPEQICLPHCTYMSHCNATVVYPKAQHYYTYQLKKNITSNKMQLKIYNATAIYVPAIIDLPNATYMPHCVITWHVVIRDVCQYMPDNWNCSHQWCGQTHTARTTQDHTTLSPSFLRGWLHHINIINPRYKNLNVQEGKTSEALKKFLRPSRIITSLSSQLAKAVPQ